MFFMPLWRTIKNSSGAGSRQEDNTVKDNNKNLKKNKYLKISSFCSVNYSNCADREKDKSNYCFPSIVKINSKKGWELSKVRREK